MLPFIALHTIKEIIRPFEIGEIEMKYGLGIFSWRNLKTSPTFYSLPVVVYGI